MRVKIYQINAEKDENTKIIILSGYSDFSFAQRAIELGVTRYLTKPTNARELIGILYILTCMFFKQLTQIVGRDTKLF